MASGILDCGEPKARVLSACQLVLPGDEVEELANAVIGVRSDDMLHQLPQVQTGGINGESTRGLDLNEKWIREDR